jgi:hypothetical protein
MVGVEPGRTEVVLDAQESRSTSIARSDGLSNG